MFVPADFSSHLNNNQAYNRSMQYSEIYLPTVKDIIDKINHVH